ncbi:DUF3619 family protein [Chitinilyticum litopenaei]|uniref:DUF3619 family protein n=1 Tax=Chitinilyticum litopenaei TaxID=1121276 RepID=UPI0003FBC5F8|nr:DUF3619 family protein [Chitinilyticum litopenaei]
MNKSVHEPAPEALARKACQQLDARALPPAVTARLARARQQALAASSVPRTPVLGQVLARQWHEHPWRWAAALLLLAALLGSWQWQQRIQEQNWETELLSSDADPDLLLSDALEQQLRQSSPRP